MVPLEIKITGMNCYLSCRIVPSAFPRQAAWYSANDFIESTAAGDGQSGSDEDSHNKFQEMINSS